MPGDIIAHALQKAAGSSPAIRAAARIRIARVQSVTDPGRARVTFEMGLEEVLGLPGAGRRLVPRTSTRGCRRSRAGSLT